MKTIKINIAALALIFGLFIAFAFKPAEKDSTQFATTYYFNGTVLADANDSASWSDTPNSISCETGTALPCQVILNESIESYLTGKTPEDVMADSNVSKRAE